MPQNQVRASYPYVPWFATCRTYRVWSLLSLVVLLSLVGRAALAADSKVLHLAAYDGNPAFLFGNDLPLDAQEAAACSKHLADQGAPRQGVAADGVSLILIKATSPEAGQWTFRLTPGSPGKLVRADDLARPAVGIETAAASREHVAFAVYVPPADFPQEAEGQRKPDQATLANQQSGDSGENVAVRSMPTFDSRELTIDGLFYPASDPSHPQHVQYELQLVRPPVVLIHGLHHNPRLAWQTPPPEHIGKTTMQQALESHGFRVFMVDYEKTNGKYNGPSRLRDNQRVLWSNPGGIREALSTLRAEGIACTQVDVVGHSMGGLLTRAYIRGYPLPSDDEVAQSDPPAQAKSWYLRDDNFHRGDVRRLITLCTPHAGSDLVRLFVCYGDVCKKLSPQEVQQAANLFALINSVFSFSSGAILDQEPESAALQALGATKVPAHAIACTASPDDFANFRAIYRWTFLAMYCFVPSNVWEATFRHEKMRQPEMAQKIVEFVSRHDRLKTGVMARLLMAFAGHEPSEPDDQQLAALQDDAVRLLCEGIFRGRPHDGAVSVRSALGGLPTEATSTIDGVLHSWAARYPSVQRRVVELLEGPSSNFHAAGFPEIQSWD